MLNELSSREVKGILQFIESSPVAGSSGRKLLLRTSPVLMSDELRSPECGSVNRGEKNQQLSDQPVLFGLAGGFQLELVPGM